jgi:predicted nucleic acid-binding protein
MKLDFNAFLDSNVLIHSTLEDYDPQKYETCSKLIVQLNELGFNIFISTQVLREFYAVVTHPTYLKKPLTPEQANIRILDFMQDFNVLTIDESVIHELMVLTKKYKIKGQKIHDTAIVATMIQNGIKNIFSYNKKDFEIFEDIKIVLPTQFKK